MATVCFTKQDLELFSAASQDRNPLHISEQYARTTPYGEPVVFGILGALAALSRLPDRHGMVLAGLSLEFRNPMTVGVNYRIEEGETTEQQSVVKIYDVERLMMKASFTFCPGEGGSQETSGSVGAYPVEAVDRKPEDFQVGGHVAGTYAPSANDFEKVVERWKLSKKGAAPIQIAAMMWASFVVGMHLPGKRAIFWRLALDFQPVDGRPWGPLPYKVKIKGFDERLDLLHTTGELFSDDRLCATAQIRAFVRPDSTQSSIAGITAFMPRSEQLKGKVALVIGGSRGLGAAISQTLALQGCSVVLNYHHSKTEAEQVRASLGEEAGLVELAQGDAADVEWCVKLREHILTKYEGVDFLICNASPPIRPLSFVPEKLEQFQDFLVKSLALVDAPMSVFIGCLCKRSGWNIIVSSAFVQNLPGEWPHYVTAKCAVEGLARWAAAQNDQIQTVLVRPPKLLTDQTNTTLGRQGAMEVERAAAAIVKYLCYSEPSKGVQILESF